MAEIKANSSVPQRSGESALDTLPSSAFVSSPSGRRNKIDVNLALGVRVVIVGDRVRETSNHASEINVRFLGPAERSIEAHRVETTQVSVET